MWQWLYHSGDTGLAAHKSTYSLNIIIKRSVRFNTSYDRKKRFAEKLVQIKCKSVIRCC